eukprot:29427-Pelagococcus_subviridis.AAC.6
MVRLLARTRAARPRRSAARAARASTSRPALIDAFVPATPSLRLTPSPSRPRRPPRAGQQREQAREGVRRGHPRRRAVLRSGELREHVLREQRPAGAVLLPAVPRSRAEVPRRARERPRGEPPDVPGRALRVDRGAEEEDRGVRPEEVHRASEEGQRAVSIVHAPRRARVSELRPERVRGDIREGTPRGAPDARGRERAADHDVDPRHLSGAADEPDAVSVVRERHVEEGGVFRSEPGRGAKRERHLVSAYVQQQRNLRQRG